MGSGAVREAEEKSGCPEMEPPPTHATHLWHVSLSVAEKFTETDLTY